MEELDYKKLAQEKKDAILNDLKELIAIDSVSYTHLTLPTT